MTKEKDNLWKIQKEFDLTRSEAENIWDFYEAAYMHGAKVNFEATTLMFAGIALCAFALSRIEGYIKNRRSN